MAASSRTAKSAAGWECAKGDYEELMNPDRRSRPRPFSWLSPKPLWESRNDRIARMFDDPTDARRQAWVERIAPPGSTFTISLGEKENATFLVAGDPGEGDGSQFAVVPPLLSPADDAELLWICSDVIYPAGGIDEYEEKFCWPYAKLELPIYAVPGNHDWYDDLSGFMYWFCGEEDPPPAVGPARSLKQRIGSWLWRRAPKADPARVKKAREVRERPAEQPHPQPGPYFALDLGPVLLVGIDTGIEGDLDHAQGEWLRRVSAATDKPKILLTGKPLFVDAKSHPGPITPDRNKVGGGTVEHIVATERHNYIAVLGGDIHNYQRYPVPLDSGRTLMCLVTGGGGAFMHETHTIPNLDSVAKLPVSEEEFRCYPLRGDSLSRFSQLYSRKLLGWCGLGSLLRIEPDAAARLMGEKLGLAPVRESAREAEVSWRERLSARLIFLLNYRGRGAFHVPFSEWLDWNEPPMFKQFLRVDTSAAEIRIRCFAATGCAAGEDDPPLEDELVARPDADGRWQWTLPKDGPQ